LGQLGLLQVQINQMNECILAAVSTAFVLAGEEMPSIPPPEEAPIFDTLMTDLENMIAEAEDPLGYLGAYFNIEYDEASGLPIRIQTR
jgi:hypothetical protein